MYQILAVDDDQQILTQIVQSMKSHNQKIFVAVNGAIALNILKEKKIDLILLDWNMPEMDGLETLNTLKKSPELRDIPVIMLTAQSAIDSIEIAYNSGVYDYIKKPFNSIELKIRVQAAIQTISYYKEIHNLKLKELEKENLISELKNKELQHELDKKLSEIQLITAHIEERNHYLREIIDTLKSDPFFANMEPGPITIEIMRKIEGIFGNSDTVQSLNEEQSQFDIPYMIQLSKLHPELSSIELKICSLLTYNLSNKDISSLLFKSVRTIESHRYHISQKINLKKGIHLRDYLMGLR